MIRRELLEDLGFEYYLWEDTVPYGEETTLVHHPVWGSTCCVSVHYGLQEEDFQKRWAQYEYIFDGDRDDERVFLRTFMYQYTKEVIDSLQITSLCLDDARRNFNRMKIEEGAGDDDIQNNN